MTFFETTSNFVVHANFKLKEVKISVPKSFSLSDLVAQHQKVSQSRRKILSFRTIMQ